MKLLIYNAVIADGSGSEPFAGWLLTDGDIIARIGRGEPAPDIAGSADEAVDAGGRYLMPGAIDCHVHFREPGMTSKATIASESRAALAGGVTSFIDMPNTIPATTTLAAWDDKMQRGARDAVINYAFMMGATADNAAELLGAPRGLMPAVKVFMGSSTGGMLLDDTTALSRVFAETGLPVVVHAEDQTIIDHNISSLPVGADLTDMRLHSQLRSAEACVRATERALELAARYGTRLHMAHVTTGAETTLFDPSDTPVGKQYTAEVSPHHLLWTIDDYPRLGWRIKMNPAVKTAADREALRRGLLAGRLDMIATDHAPHRVADKQGDVLHAASGAPMVQFSLVSVTDMFGPAVAARRMAATPALTYGIRGRGILAEGYMADMVMVERLDEPHVITDADVLSPCGWTPMQGYATRHRVVRTWVNGGNGPRALQFDR